ncbi:MAG: DUF333 domain-containing protein [Candidatus Levybacteria bacterium]|nr:DUF333 domain-containing protein [Candidatus Levybacteria bacterium]
MRKVILLVLTVVLIAGLIPFFQGTKTTSSPITTEKYQKQRLANPASVNCEKEGGTTVIQTNGSGGQYGLCMFEDDMACEEWALFRKECPVGGIKTTGFDTIEQKYCAWIGGQTLAVENATCTMPDGTVCRDDALYNGTCPAN